MNKPLYYIGITALLAATSIPTMAQENLVYVAVSPCRLVDTRVAGGAIPANTSRNFLVSGAMAGQGGNAGGCPAPTPGSEPLAISAYVLAVPPDTGTADGILTAFPSGQPDPAPGTGSTVNFNAGQIIGNTTNITLCDPTGSCPTDGEFAILSRTSAEHVVVDVQGYFYSASSAATSCTDDMVAVGSICIDTYEASVWNAPTGGNQILASTCLADGSDCGKNAANPIYAKSVVNVTPANQISWYQAAQACANVGKRLPTTAEWQMAASGTPPGPNATPTESCNTTFGAVAVTGASAAGTTPCVSSWGTFDMVGNLWEWTAEMTDFATGSGFTFADTDNGWSRILGASYTSGINNTQALATVGDGPSLANNSEIGFRCVR